LTIALAGCGSSSNETAEAGTATKSTAPAAPADEYTKFQSSYADVDQQNTRDARSGLKAANVARLEEVWSRPIEGTGEGEGFVASPIVTDDIVFVQDLDSNVAALNLRDGKPYWEKRYDVPAVPPGGLTVSRGFQMVIGATPTEAFGIDERSGKEVWATPLTDSGSNPRVGMTPGYYNGLAYFAGQPHDGGVLWGLDVRTGAKRLRFEPGKKGAGLGRGLTGVPAFDFKGSVFMGSGSPGPSSVFKFDETGGKFEWNRRLAPAGAPSGAWDPVIVLRGGKKVVIAASRSGKVVALDRHVGSTLWQHRSGSEVVGPIAAGGGTVFVPTGDGRHGGLQALSVASGTLRWKQSLPVPLAGPVLLTDDVIFATSADGSVYAFAAKSGKKLWSDRASSSGEGGLAIGGRTLLVRVGTPGSEPGPELIAYRLGS
jgi:outer membrane protein assembly factor BamB